MIKNAFALKTATRFFSLDLKGLAKNKNDSFNGILTENHEGVYLPLFNWGENKRQIIMGGGKNTESSDAFSN